MEQKILDALNKSNKAYTVSELNSELGLKSIDDFKELLKTLNRMEDELKIHHTNKDKFMLFTNNNLKLGRLIAHKKGFGFVDIEGDNDVFIAPVNMNGAIHGDKVVVEITAQKGIDLEGRIVKIVERSLKEMVGEFYTNAGISYIELDDDKVKITVQIDPSKTMGAVPGHKVLVKITDKLKDNNYRGEVIKVLGHKNDPGVDILSIVHKYGINDDFSEEVMQEVNTLPETVTITELGKRKDLRNEVTFTIDGDDAKDLDDAVSLHMLDNGNYQLGVHIADVDYYVKEGSKIDLEAYDRGTSVYLADRVIPMLPHKLSNGICSLTGGVDRLTMTCDMEIDATGKVVKYDIYESVINSKLRMTYNLVNDVIERGLTPAGYEPFKDTLLKMQELAHILRKFKENRGMIDFNIDEAKIVVDDSGKAIDIVLRERGEGERLIEDFMIAANETVATHIFFMELPFVYRIHGEPKQEKIDNFLKYVSLLGYKIDGKVSDVHPKTMQKILDSLMDKKEYPILSRLLLRSMQKAVYDKNNIGHYGLASKYYTHFTSPIRRYPDTTVHRLLRTYLFENKIDKQTTEYWNQKLVALTEHSSQKEKDSVECEREVDDMKKAEYMMQHIGEEFSGMVTSVLSFGMFVELPNLIEGLVRLDELNLIDKQDRYFFDEVTFSIRSPKNPRGFRLGDQVTIKVIAANKEAKTIDFTIPTLKPVKEIEKPII